MKNIVQLRPIATLLEDQSSEDITVPEIHLEGEADSDSASVGALSDGGASSFGRVSTVVIVIDKCIQSLL